MYGYEHINLGTPIRGNDGVDVYLREGSYWIEHFSIDMDSNNAFVRLAIGPFASRAEANQIEQLYRQRWGFNG